MNNPKKYHVLISQLYWFCIHKYRVGCGNWIKLEDKVCLEEDYLLSRIRETSLKDLRRIWGAEILVGVVKMEGFDTFEEVVDYLRDLLFYAELKK